MRCWAHASADSHSLLRYPATPLRFHPPAPGGSETHAVGWSASYRFVTTLVSSPANSARHRLASRTCEPNNGSSNLCPDGNGAPMMQTMAKKRLPLGAKQESGKNYSYIVANDNNHAPCLQDEICSFCNCKPLIRGSPHAVEGTYMVGCSKHTMGYLRRPKYH